MRPPFNSGSGSLPILVKPSASVLVAGVTLTAKAATGYVIDPTTIQWWRDIGDGNPQSVSAAGVNPYTISPSDIAPFGTAYAYRIYPLATLSKVSSSPLSVPVSSISYGPLLRFASTYNRVATSVAQSGAGNTIRLSTVKNAKIGSGDFSYVCLKFDNHFFSAGGNPIQGPGNSIKVIGAQIGWDTLTGYFDVTWNGSKTITIADGQTDIVSDPIPASTFGQSAITAGAPIFITSTIEVTNGNIPHLEGTDTQVEGIIYDPAVSTLNVTAPYTPTVSGAPIKGQSGGSPFMLVGKFVTGDPRVVMLNGDSLFAQGFGASYGVGAMIIDSNLACCQVGRVGGAESVVNQYPDLFANCYLKYANCVVDEYGTNTIGGDLTNDTANLQGSSLTAWAFFKTRYLPHPNARAFKLVRMSLLQRTSGSYGSDLTTQTVSAGWGAAQSAEVFDDWCLSQVGIGNGPDMFIDPNVGTHGTTRGGATRSDPNYYKWAANLTIDGLHNNSTGKPILAGNMRDKLNTLA